MNEDLVEFCKTYKETKELKMGKHKLKAIILEGKDE